MTRAPRVRGLLALAAVALSLFIALTTPVQLGLDLRGGTQIVLETRPTDTTPADSEATDRTLEVLRGRVDALGVAEPTLTRSGDNRIVVELPGVQDPAEAAEILAAPPGSPSTRSSARPPPTPRTRPRTRSRPRRRRRSRVTPSWPTSPAPSCAWKRPR